MELLLVLGVIAVISAIAVPLMARIGDNADIGAAKRNAQTLCTLFQGAQSTGATFSATSKSGIADELIAGVTGPYMDGSIFQAEMTNEDRDHALAYIDYDVVNQSLVYNPDN